MTPLDAKMAELRTRLADRFAEDRRVFAQLVEVDDREAIVDRAHRLAGIAGMLGAPDVGAAALALEDAARTDGTFAEEARRLLALLDGFAA